MVSNDDPTSSKCRARKGYFFFEKSTIYTKKRENLTLEAQALGLRVKLKAAENKLREAELHHAFMSDIMN